MKALLALVPVMTLAATGAFGASDTDVDFGGRWSGTGQLTERNPFTGPRTSPCSSVEITIEHLPSQMTVEKYHAICGSLDSDWGPVVMEIREGRIYEDGEETGTLEGNLLRTLESSGGVRYAFNLRLNPPTENGPAMLESYYGVSNRAGTMVIEGNLFRR